MVETSRKEAVDAIKATLHALNETITIIKRVRVLISKVEFE